MDNSITVGGILLSVGSWLLWVTPAVQFVASIIGLGLLYWSYRKKKAEALKLEKDNIINQRIEKHLDEREHRKDRN